MDTISIITPSFNQGCFLDDTISSVLSQSGDFYIDYIIVDGGSTDESVTIIREYERLLRENCKTVQRDGLTYFVNKKASFQFCNCRGISYRWISEPDNGQSHAINKGISLMAGDFFAWLNSDDYYIGADVFSKVLDFFNAHPNSGMIYGRGYCVNDKKQVFRDFHDNCTTLSFSRRILQHECFILQPAVFVRSEVVRDTGPVDESLNWCMDWDYWLRIANKHTVTFFPSWIACWRQYDGIKSFIFNKNMVAERDRMLMKYSGFPRYVLNRWYYQATMFPLQYLISLRHSNALVKAALFVTEIGTNYLLRFLMRALGEKRASSSVTRIAIFTPLDPVDSEIAQYNTRLIQAILRKKPGLFVDVYVDGDYAPESIESPGFRVIRHEKFYRNHYIYDTVLYKVGDDYRRNKYMFPYVRRYGGIVELDDAKLNKTYLQIIEELKRSMREKRFIQSLRICFLYPSLRYYAWYKIVKPLFGYNKELYLDRHLYRTSFLVKKADSIIVRDQHPVRHYRLPGRKCTVLAKGCEISSFADGTDLAKVRRRLRIPKNAFVMIVLGDDSALPGAGALIKALASVRKQVPALHCVLTGDRSPGEGSLQSLVRAHRLEKRVRITGRLSSEEMLDYQYIADAGIDLGTRGRGGLTVPLKDAFDQGRILFMPGYDKDGLHGDGPLQRKQRNDDLERMIADRILWLYGNPGHLYRMGLRGYRVDEKAPKLNDAVISGYCEALGL